MRFLTALALVALISCGEAAAPAIEQTAEPVRADEPSIEQRTERAFEEFNELYAALRMIKDDPTFHKVGFGAGGPHAQWLADVKRFGGTEDAKLLAKKGVVSQELEALGMAYASSGGQETDETRKWNDLFVQAIDAKPVEVVESVSGATHFDALKAESDLVGRWKITNTFAKDSYPLEIYERKSGGFVAVYPQRDFKTEELELKGNDYFIRGSRSGDFYRIDKNRKMTLFDKDGELASSGWVAELLK